MTIAFLGLGNMGSGMAHRLIQAGRSLRVWNRSPKKAEAFTNAGAIACSSPSSAIDGAEVVISSLMDDASIREVFGAPGEGKSVIAKMVPGAIHLCTTTISPGCADWLADEHQKHGSRYVSGPVLGRPDAAASGTLLEFLAGDGSAIEELKPVCEAFANTLVPMSGPASVANYQKLCANLFIISLVEVMAECYTFAEKSGASPEIAAQIFDRSFAHPGLKAYARRLLERNTDGSGGFSMRGGLKDVRLMLDAANQVGCPLDLAQLIEGKMAECVEHGFADADWSAVQQVTRARAGLAQ